MSKLTPSSLVFMAELLDCMLDDIDVTINDSNDSDLIRSLLSVRNRISSSYQIINNLNCRRKYNERF